MIEPYEGEPNNYGIAVTDKETLYDYGRKAIMGGLAMTVHAIGDKANHDLLDVYEQLRKEEDQTSNFKLQTSKNSKLKTQNFYATAPNICKSFTPTTWRASAN